MKKGLILALVVIFCFTNSLVLAADTSKDSKPAENLQNSRMFAVLPDYVATPDGMTVAPDGDLILACPNFGDAKQPGCLVKISQNREIRKWVDVPVLAETGHAYPMGIAFGPDGDIYICDNQAWPGTQEGQFKGRILRLKIQDNKIINTTVVAQGMEHPNGIRIRDGYAYVTESSMTKVKDPSGLLVSGVYKFKLDDKNINVTNTLADKNLLFTVVTKNKDCQYGLDGIEFDREGNLLVGNFGDGAVHKVIFNADGTVKSNTVWAKNPAQLTTTDGMYMDSCGNLFISDFSVNAVARVTPDGKVTRIAQSGDSDGMRGELDQPGEPIVWNGKLILSCFDMVTDSGKVNRVATDGPSTLVEVDYMQISKLFSILPDYVATPDGMVVAPDGDLVVACPNFGDSNKPSCLIKINKNKEVTKWVEVPVLADTGHSYPMGIAFGPDGDIYICDNQGWPGTPEGQNKGRILRLKVKNNKIENTTVIAEGMEHPNGIRIRDGYAYVTQSSMVNVKDPSGLLVSGVYKFKLTDKNIKVKNTLDDKNLLFTVVTKNKDCQYGLDGIEFDKQGNLLVGNFGDGAVHKITFNKDGSVKSNTVWAQDPTNLTTTDGMFMDKDGTLYIADFSVNAVAKVSADGKVVTRIAQSPDTDGLRGQLDQPGEPIVWNGKLILTCFDMVTDPSKVNRTATDGPATMAQIELK